MKTSYCDIALHFQDWPERELLRCAQEYAETPAIPQDLKLERRVFFGGALYHMWDAYVADQATLLRCPNSDWASLRDLIQKSVANRVYSRARLSDSPDAYAGWELDMTAPWNANCTLNIEGILR